MNVIVGKLWLGGDALVQRVLLRNHCSESDAHWPFFGLSKKILSNACASSITEIKIAITFLTKIGNKLLWQPNQKTTDITNAPLLAGFFMQFDTSASWFCGEFIYQLRQIRNFDPEWFDVAIQTGYILALKAKQADAKSHHKRQ